MAQIGSQTEQVRIHESVSTSQYQRVSIQTLSVFYICLTTITIQFQYMKQNPIELCSFSLFAATSSITWIDVRQTTLSIDLKLKSHDAVLLQGRSRWGRWGGLGGLKTTGGQYCEPALCWQLCQEVWGVVAMAPWQSTSCWGEGSVLARPLT